MRCPASLTYAHCYTHLQRVTTMKNYFTMLIFVSLCNYNVCDGDGMLGKITSGFQIAGKIFGLDHVGKITQLVTEAFGKSTNKVDGGENKNNVFTGFLRLLGFDTKKIGAMAVNAIIFLAQLISSTVSGNQAPKLTHVHRMNEENPFEWMINNFNMSSGLLNQTKHTDLSKHIIEYIKEHSLDEETGCVQLLVCKISPFIRGMQVSLTTNTTTYGKRSLFEYLPSANEVAEVGDKCEARHPYCKILY